MDPTAELCQPYDSLIDPPPYLSDYLGGSYHEEQALPLTSKFTPHSTSTPLDPIYVDQYQYRKLHHLKYTFSNPTITPELFRTARIDANPYERIGTSIFANRAGVKLANIDAVRHVTGTVFTPTHLTDSSPFTFCDVAGGPGSFTQYLQYRYPNSQGYGITLESAAGLDWNDRVVDKKRFDSYYGPSNTGNLYLEAPSFISYVLSKEPNGVDLVVADGGFEVDDDAEASGKSDASKYQQQEFLSSRLILAEAMVAVACCKQGGNAVIKVFDTVTRWSAELILLLGQCFDTITLFKPVSSRPANGEQYLLCMGRRLAVKNYYDILMNSYQQYTDQQYSSSLIQQFIPDRFREWITNSNNASVKRQWVACERIIRLLAQQPVQIPPVNVSKALLLWNIPDQPVTLS